jgi:hypothetical protein
MSKREKVVRAKPVTMAWAPFDKRTGELIIRATDTQGVPYRGSKKPVALHPDLYGYVRVEIRVVPPKARKKAKAAQRAAGGGA